jgi:hypothetical protein
MIYLYFLNFWQTKNAENTIEQKNKTWQTLLWPSTNNTIWKLFDKVIQGGNNEHDLKLFFLSYTNVAVYGF